jgi:hypothetical protein
MTPKGLVSRSFTQRDMQRFMDRSEAPDGPWGESTVSENHGTAA